MSEEYTGSDNLEVMLEAHRYNNYLKHLVRQFAGKPSTALDFGAGIGTFTSALQNVVKDISCVEPDVEAREYLKQQGYHAVADIEDISGTVDYIFSLNVMEHIEDDHAMARALYERLAPGAPIFIYVPAFNHLRSSMDDLVGHHRRYTRASLQTLLEGAGFEIETLAYTDFLGYFATLLFKFLEIFQREPGGTINRPLLLLYDRVFFPVSRVLSVLFAGIAGKNVYAVARRPETS